MAKPQTATVTKRSAAPAKAAPATPMAPMFKMGHWPVKSQAGNTIRAYAYKVATKLAKANPKGFTLAQFKVALVAGANNTNCTQPSGGWAGHNMPTWASHAKQQWLLPAGK